MYDVLYVCTSSVIPTGVCTVDTELSLTGLPKTDGETALTLVPNAG